MPASELKIQYGGLRQNITRIDKVSNLYLFFMMLWDVRAPCYLAKRFSEPV